jgi:hypothetical protein
MNKTLVSALAAIVTMGLSGCAPVPSWMEWAKGGRPCQSVSILSKASTMPLGALSKGDTRTLTITDLGSSCGVMPENMEIIDEQAVGIVFTATVPGASSKSNIPSELKWINVPVFIALLDKAGSVVCRRDYEFSMTINNESTWSRQRVAFPLPSHIKTGDEAYKVIVGLNAPVCKKAAAVAAEAEKHHKKHGHKKHTHKKHKAASGKESTEGAAKDGEKKTTADATSKEPLSFGMTRAG